MGLAVQRGIVSVGSVTCKSAVQELAQRLPGSSLSGVDVLYDGNCLISICKETIPPISTRRVVLQMAAGAILENASSPGGRGERCGQHTLMVGRPPAGNYVVSVCLIDGNIDRACPLAIPS